MPSKVIEIASGSSISFARQLGQLTSLPGDSVKREKYFPVIYTDQALTHMAQGFTWLSSAASRITDFVELKDNAERAIDEERDARKRAKTEVEDLKTSIQKK